MTKITQISATALLVAIASTAFVSTAEAAKGKAHCKQTSFSIFRTACEEPIRRKFRQRYRRIDGPVRPQVNFRSRSTKELGERSLNGGGNGGGQGGKR